MSNLSDRVSYLRGLAEGLQVDTQSNEGKLITQLIDVLSEVVDEIDEMHEEIDELNEYVESIDNDLAEIEGDFDGDEFDDDDDDDDDEEDDDEDDEDDDVLDFFARGDFDEEDDEEGEVGMYVGCICPKCGGMFCVDAYQNEDDQMFVCPHCSETVEAKPMDNDNVPIAKLFTEDEGE